MNIVVTGVGVQVMYCGVGEWKSKFWGNRETGDRFWVGSVSSPRPSELCCSSAHFIMTSPEICDLGLYHSTFTATQHTRLTALCPGLPRWAGTRKVKPIWILLKQETVSGSGIIWAICKSTPRSRQITMPAPTTQFFYRPDALPVAQPTVSKHRRHVHCHATVMK